MPSSNLRILSPIEGPIDTHATYHQTSPVLSQRPAKRQRMSLTQTYYVASTARSKLGREAGRADHNLRRLVGHANLLDNLMVELQDAEREQEAWFNQSLSTASKPEEPKHIMWLDQIVENDEMDEGSDSESESDDEEYTQSQMGFDEEDDAEFDDEDNQELSLTRVASKHSPPELTMDDDEDSEDEDECPSPGSLSLELSEKERQQMATTALFDLKSQNGMEDYLTSRPIAAC